MRPHRLACFIFLAAAAACERRRAPDPSAMVRKALQGMLVYPLSTPVSESAGEDAAQVTMATSDSVGPVARWFRRALQLNGWTLASDVTNPDGSVVMSATKGKRPVWVTLRPNVGAPGTTYTVVGAIVDSTAADSERAPGVQAAPPAADTARPVRGRTTGHTPE